MNWTLHDTFALIRAAGERPRLRSLAEVRALVKVIGRHHHEDELVETLARLQPLFEANDGKPFVWGERDCSLVLADWLVLNGYPDPAIDLRGTYADEDGCKAVLDGQGGVLGVVGNCAARAGLSPAHEPRCGAVAVIGSPTNPARQWGAIYSGTGWMVFWRDGWTNFASARCLKMWDV